MFANSSAFATPARTLVDDADPPAQVIILDCEDIFAIDFTGCEALEGLILDVRGRGLDVRLARVHTPVLRKLRASGVVTLLGEESVFAQIEDAVAAGVGSPT